MPLPTFLKFVDHKNVRRANIRRAVILELECHRTYADRQTRWSWKLSHWVTVGSLPVTPGPHLADHAQTRNVRNANKNGHKRTDRNLCENVVRLCKTFIHRFDSDRRLQSTQQLRDTYKLSEKPTVVKNVVSRCIVGV